MDWVVGAMLDDLGPELRDAASQYDGRQHADTDGTAQKGQLKRVVAAIQVTGQGRRRHIEQGSEQHPDRTLQGI